jgi:hypothetical protein
MRRGFGGLSSQAWGAPVPSGAVPSGPPPLAVLAAHPRVIQLMRDGMMKNFFWLMAAFLVGCSSSRPYKPLPWEAKLIQVHKAQPFPNEVSPSVDTGKFHWLGIIDTFYVEGKDSQSVLYIKAEHHYWDYIEDFSIQREKMFVSPLGAGSFWYRKEVKNEPVDTTKARLSILAHKRNIGMFYGALSGEKGGLPILNGAGVRFIHRQFYSTRIWSYEIRKDSSGNYKEVNHQVLMVPGPGINDPEDKEDEEEK